MERQALIDLMIAHMTAAAEGGDIPRADALVALLEGMPDEIIIAVAEAFV